MSAAVTAEQTALDFLSGLIERARAAGAGAVDAVLIDSTSLSVSQRLGKREDLERSESGDFGLRVLVGRRQAVVSSSDRGDKSVAELVERAVAMARAAPEDPHCGLADPEWLCADPPALDLADTGEPSAGTLYDRAAAAEDAARAVEGITNSEGAQASWGRSTVGLATSGGFAGAYTGTRYGLAASVLAGVGRGMERDYDWVSVRHESDLEDPAALGRRAGERAVARLNPKKVSTAQVPVLYDPRISNGLVRSLSGAVSGSSVARGTSFLKDKMGERIFAPGISVIDDPHRARGLSSRPFDGEGVTTKRLAVIEEGVLMTWFLDRATGHQLGLPSTGHAARGTSAPPSPSSSNLYLEAGSQSRADMIAGIDAGFYVTELMGMGVNPVTGDYSRGASGFWIDKGEIAYPVSELTIAGNLKDMFLNLTPDDDLEFRYGVNAPTLRIDGMTVAGA
ncbi:MAG TPA: metallopeptidase TldD-related protein [Alphaproteobacteria bacterium]|nr:metallopeptidase TldD-related protein [Alphaproteobacteria bacterium]